MEGPNFPMCEKLATCLWIIIKVKLQEEFVLNSFLSYVNCSWFITPKAVWTFKPCSILRKSKQTIVNISIVTHKVLPPCKLANYNLKTTFLKQENGNNYMIFDRKYAYFCKIHFDIRCIGSMKSNDLFQNECPWFLFRGENPDIMGLYKG